MRNIMNGIASGFAATLAAGSMMLMKNALHRLPELHVARTLSEVLGSPDRALAGWIAFLVIGIVIFGVLFALLEPRLPGRSYLAKGIIFAAITWLIHMAVILPLTGAGVFGMDRGPVLAAAALVLHLVYWVVLSLIYRQGVAPSAQAVRRRA